jgi:deoxyribonuclease V
VHIPVKHSWPTDLKKASALQKSLAGRVRISRLTNRPETVGAVDVAYIGPVRRQTHLVAGVVICDIESGQTLERRSARSRITVPYVPGFLSFREAPVVLKAINRLSQTPDVFVVDGHGLAHPRLFGVACHLGVLTDRPTIGCAKSLLVGTPNRPLAAERGHWVELEYAGQVVGAIVRTRSNVKPVYVSVGHRITLDEAVELVFRLADRYRLPEPVRRAHNYVTELARKGKSGPAAG